MPDYDARINNAYTSAETEGPPSSSSSSEAHRRWYRLVFGASALVLLVLISYWPSLNGGFIWDDLVLVKKNPLATGALNLRNIWLAGDFSLTTVATWLERLVFGESPLGYRLVNLILHCANACLI